MAATISQQCQDLIKFQRGVVARRQVAGQAPDLAVIDALLHSGRWQSVYRGVYASYTGRPERDSVLWAAVLRCGSGAALSHFTAAELDGLLDRASEAIHVTIPLQRRVWVSDEEFGDGRPRIIVYRTARCTATTHPSRTPPRIRTAETVLDLTDLADSFDAAFAWLSTSCSRRLLTVDQLRAAAARRERLRWRADVSAALEEIAQGVHSNLERGYLRNVERPHRLPKARRQMRQRQGSRSAYLDNSYDDFGLAVELDGLGTHPAESRWQDIRRDNYMAEAGIITLRYSWADISRRPCQVAAQIGQVLQIRGWTGSLVSCRLECLAGLRRTG